MSVEFALNTAISAATEVEILKSCVQQQSQEMDDFKLQFAKLESDQYALHSKVGRLEDHSRKDNLLVHGKEMKLMNTAKERSMNLSGLRLIYHNIYWTI